MYKNPPPDGRVICFDEFGPLELRPYPGANWAPIKKPNRLAATYRRTHGVRHLLAAYDLKDNKIFAHVKKRKTHKETLGFLQYLRRRFPGERLYIILDNFSPHKHKKVVKWAEINNVELVYTPTYASWLNRIECHFAPLRYFVLKNSYYKSHEEMALKIRHYIRWRNKNVNHKLIIKEQNKIKVA